MLLQVVLWFLIFIFYFAQEYAHSISQAALMTYAEIIEIPLKMRGYKGMP
jgi:hypothetical protein